MFRRLFLVLYIFCQCVFYFKNNDENLFRLFQTSTCFMPNGIIHVRLFDRRTFGDLRSLSLEKNSKFMFIIRLSSIYTFFYTLFFLLKERIKKIIKRTRITIVLSILLVWLKCRSWWWRELIIKIGSIIYKLIKI